MTAANTDLASAMTRDAVIQQLEWDSQVNPTDIGVAARGGVVTLTGVIDTYAGKLAAERAAKRVRGVRAVANDLQVRLRLTRTDTEIAADIDAALRMRAAIPDAVQAVVHQGHVTLTGVVPTYFLKALAAEAVRHISGVINVTNYVGVEAVATARDLRRMIVHALHRSAEIDARGVATTVNGSTVRLDGEVGSWAEVEAIEAAVAHAPGITQVDNHLTIAPHLVPIPAVDGELC